MPVLGRPKLNLFSNLTAGIAWSLLLVAWSKGRSIYRLGVAAAVAQRGARRSLQVRIAPKVSRQHGLSARAPANTGVQSTVGRSDADDPKETFKSENQGEIVDG